MEKTKVWNLTINTSEQGHWRVFVADEKQISHISGVCIVDFEQVNNSSVFYFYE